MTFSPATLVARIGWRNLAIGVTAAIAVVATETFLHDPFGLRRARQARLEQAVSTAQALAQTKGLEADGERAGAQRVAITVRTAEQARDVTESLVQAAEKADDANLGLDPDRAARLRAHDEALCQLDRLRGCDGEGQ
jgi:hypothetical protein